MKLVSGNTIRVSGYPVSFLMRTLYCTVKVNSSITQFQACCYFDK